MGSEIVQEIESSERLSDDVLEGFSAEDMNFVHEVSGSEYNGRLQDARERAEQFFGSKEFSYTHNGGMTYTGTAAQIIDGCPHAQTIAGENGFDAFASFIAPHEKKQDEEKLDDGDEKAKDDAVAIAPVKKTQTTGDSVTIKPDASLQETSVVEKGVDSATTAPTKNIADAGPIMPPIGTFGNQKQKILGAEVTKPEASTIVLREFLDKVKSVEPVASRPDELLEIPVAVEITDQEEKSRAIKEAQVEVFSFYEEELVLLANLSTEMITDTEEEIGLEDEIFLSQDPQPELEEDTNVYHFESLLEQVDVSLYEAFLVGENDEPVDTYEDVYDLVQESQDIPVEIVFANLLDIDISTDAFEAMQDESNDMALLTLPERAFMRAGFREAILHLRIELAYVDISDETLFEQLPINLQEQLIDLLYRLGYDDASRVMLELVERHSLGYLLYFFSQVGANVERTVRPPNVTLARKKKRQPGSYLTIPAKMAQFVIESLRSATLVFSL